MIWLLAFWLIPALISWALSHSYLTKTKADPDSMSLILVIVPGINIINIGILGMLWFIDVEWKGSRNFYRRFFSLGD